MRYFLAKDEGSVVREKLAFGGDEAQAEGMVASYLTAHPGWTAPEADQATFDSTVVVVDPAPLRVAAVLQLLSDTSPNAKAYRAAIFGLLDEINLLRQRDNDRSTDVAAATTLADLKTRWAARPVMPVRTINQAKQVVQDKVTTGTAD